MAPALLLKPCVSAPSTNWSQQKFHPKSSNANVKVRERFEVVAMGMLSPRKFMQRRRKTEVFKDAEDEADQRNWRRLMKRIEDTGSAVSVLRAEKIKNQALPKDLVLGTLVRFKQLKKWNLVAEILEWLRTQQWWDFNEMDFRMLMVAYGKEGNFPAAEKILSYMNKKGYAPHVVSYTALMEAYGRGGRYNNAEAIFRRMQTSGPEPSALTYQIILKAFVEGNKFKEAEEVFETLLSDEKLPIKPDQKMFHMMIYMYKKAGSYEKARRILSMMAGQGVVQSTVTYNSLMSFETNYKEVSKIYDQMQRSGLRPDVVSYALLINAYGKARREEEALAVFEEMLDAGVRPSHKAYNILLDAFAISGMVEQARTVFKSMRRDRCTPDVCSYTTMLSAYVNASDMEGAEKFFERLIRDGVKPNVVTYGTLIKGYAKVNNFERMMEKYEEMLLNGVRVNEMILTTIMDAHGKNEDFDSAIIWYKEMEKNSISPDQKAKNILLSLAKTEDERKEANLLAGNSDDVNIPAINETASVVDDEYSDDDEEDEDGGEYDDEEDEDGGEYDEEEDRTDTISFRDQQQLIDLNGDNQEVWKSLTTLEVTDL